MRLHRVALAVLVLTFAAAPSAAHNFYKGMEAYQEADYGTALREWGPLAVRGDQITQYNLGVLYDGGLGVPAYKLRARLWYRKAAEQGFAQAQNYLGRMFYLGDDVPPEYVRAVAYYWPAPYKASPFPIFFWV